MDRERAGVNVADRVDEAHHTTGAAQVQPGERTGRAQARQVEEGVAGEHPVTLGHQPVVELHLLLGGGVEFVPHFGAAPGRTQPGDPQCGTVTCCLCGESAKWSYVVPRTSDRDPCALKL